MTDVTRTLHHDDTNKELGWFIGNRLTFGDDNKWNVPVVDVVPCLPQFPVWLRRLPFVILGLTVASVVTGMLLTQLAPVHWLASAPHWYSPGRWTGGAVADGEWPKIQTAQTFKEIGVVGFFVFLFSAIGLLPKRSSQDVRVFRLPLDVALLNRLPCHVLLDPELLLRALHRLVEDDDPAVEQRRSQNCIQLLNDDDYADDMVELVRILASTDNPSTLTEARDAVDEMCELRHRDLLELAGGKMAAIVAGV